MKESITILRVGFIVVCALVSWLICVTDPDWDRYWLQTVAVGTLLGTLVVLVDILLKGFSLRAFTALTFGLAIGGLMAFLITKSPLFEKGEPEYLFLARLGMFLVCTYLGAVMALRSRDEFNLIVPYVKFVPHGVESPLIVVDASALIDGRLAPLCESGFVSSAIVVPRIVLNQLHHIADSPDPARAARGRRGLEVLNQLRNLKDIDLRIHESTGAGQGEVESRLVFLAQSLKAKLLTTDYNLARLAQFHGIRWLNLTSLGKALAKDWLVGEHLTVDLVRAGREDGQAVGYLDDGSMVVVTNGRPLIGRRVNAEILSIVPSAGGRILFARHHPESGSEPLTHESSPPAHGDSTPPIRSPRPTSGVAS